MIAVTVQFQIKPDKVAEFHPVILRQAANSLNNEEACRRFDVCVNPEDACHYYLYEVYDDDAAFDAHQKTEYFKTFFETVVDWVIAKDLQTWNIADPEQ